MNDISRPLAEPRKFILAGNARFTLRSTKTGARYTYKVRQADAENAAEKPDLWFVSLLVGPDNESDYQYIGIVNSGLEFRSTKKSRLPIESAPVAAIAWTIKRLKENPACPDGLEIWHEGSCGRCGRTLTVPESIESGFGPECIKHVC